MSDENVARPGEGIVPPEGQEVTKDYSRLGFRALRQLCKDRGVPADGDAAALIGKLQLWDLEHGAEINTEVSEGADEDIDLLADDEPEHVQPTPGDNPGTTDQNRATAQPPADGGEVASLTPPSAGSRDGAVTVAPGAPAVTVVAAPDAAALPPSTRQGGRPNLDARAGLVKVGEGHGAAEVRAFRAEYTVGPREISDAEHMAYIADTHAAAQAAGHTTKGGITVGERVGYSTDAGGTRTAIYQVSVKRQQA
jgi:hypothetical protein